MNAVREMGHECRNISFGWLVDDECPKTFVFIGSFNALVNKLKGFQRLLWAEKINPRLHVYFKF